MLQRVRYRFPADAVISSGIALFGLAAIAAGMLQAIWFLPPVMLVAGAAWVSFLSLFNVQLLNRAPDWVRARALAISLLVFHGALAGGSAVWGAIALRGGISQALLWAGFGGNPKLGNGAVFAHLGCPSGSDTLEPLASPGRRSRSRSSVLVTVEYDVSSRRE